MPRGKISDANLQHAKIYKLIVAGRDEIYIGSTTMTLETRKWHHDHAAANPDTQTQSASCGLYYLGDVEIELLEAYPCTSLLELAKRERWWIENTPTCINSNIPAQTWQERRARRQEGHDAYMKAYRAERITCECGKSFGKAEKARHERSAKHLKWKETTTHGERV